MTDRILIHLGTDGEWLKFALDNLADDVIDDSEAGQRGEKRSVFVRMVASAYIADSGQTADLLRQVKAILPSPQFTPPDPRGGRPKERGA